MYIIQNAWKSIVRSKGRNILIGIIALIIALSGCLALSIRQAAETAREDFDFESLAGEALTLDDYMIYTEALSDGDSYYYTMSASLNASGDLVPYGESEEEETTDTDTNTQTENTQPDMPGGGMGGGAGSGGGGDAAGGGASGGL